LRFAADAAMVSTTKKDGKEDRAGALLANVQPLAAMLSGPDADLDAECRDHTNMYGLLGDPLLSLRRPEPLSLKAPDRVVAGESVTIQIETEYAGIVRCVLTRSGTAPIITAKHVREGASKVSITLPASVVPGVYRLTASLVGRKNNRLAAAGAELHIVTPHIGHTRRPEVQRR
jgi:hypothetical protein